jgi:hypothetical protein
MTEAAMNLNQTRLKLPESLALAAECLRAGTQALGLVDNDPLQLPPLLTPGREPVLPAQSLRTMAAMMLQSELEQACVIAVVELVAEVRLRLDLASSATMRLLEDFALRERDSYNRTQREAIFARLFGTGGGATSGRGAEVNNDFQQLFGAFCYALSRYAADLSWGRPLGPSAEAPLRQAATVVVLNLAPRQFGNTLVAGRMIGDQLQRAVQILSDSGLQAYFQSQSMWDTVRKILGAQTPDLGRLITRGQSGLRLLNWLAGVLDNLNDPRASRPLATAREPVFTWAAQWLQATGLSPAGADASRRVA